MTGDDDTPGGEPAWHERPSTVLGASVGALIVLAILFFGVSCVAREFSEPEQAPSYYIVPSTSGSGSTSTSSTSTSQTITSTVPPLTTDINPGDTTTSSSTDTSTSETSSSGRPPRTTDDDGETTTRSRPRLNETRTLYPRP